jgi:hypothetical protein
MHHLFVTPNSRCQIASLTSLQIDFVLFVLDTKTKKVILFNLKLPSRAKLIEIPGRAKCCLILSASLNSNFLLYGFCLLARNDK